MKKLLTIFISLFVVFNCTSVLSSELDDYAGVDNAWDGQKAITNKEFEDTIKALEEKKNKKMLKEKKKKNKKISGGGTSLHSELNPDNEIKELQSIKTLKENDILINFPVDIILKDKILEKGYYNILVEKDENNTVQMLFYQAQFLKGKVAAQETGDDFGEPELNFAKIQSYHNSYLKLIYGSVDFNAYVYLPYIE